MFHGEYRQLQADHAPDFTRPQAARVHDMIGVDGAVFGNHIPGAVAARFEIDDPVLAHDLGAAELCGFRISMRHAVGVDVAFDRVEQRADEMRLVHQRIDFFGF